jgi:hypothetical protein
MSSGRILLRHERRMAKLYQRRPLVRQQLSQNVPESTNWTKVLLARLPVTLPLLWGIWRTIRKAAVLFR